MAAVQALCDKALYLQKGRVKAIGEVDALVSQYQSDANLGKDSQFADPVKLGDGLELLFIKFDPDPVKSGKSLRFAMEFRARKQVRITEFAVLIYSAEGVRIAILDFRPYGLPTSLSAGQTWPLSGEIKSVPFVEGDYHVGLYTNVGDFSGDTLELANLTVAPANRGQGQTPYLPTNRGLVELDFTASFQPLKPR